MIGGLMRFIDLSRIDFINVAGVGHIKEKDRGSVDLITPISISNNSGNNSLIPLRHFNEILIKQHLPRLPTTWKAEYMWLTDRYSELYGMRPFSRKYVRHLGRNG